ncbi:hypothetical protein ACRRTK_016724 [Alexandromys fortis]
MCLEVLGPERGSEEQSKCLPLEVATSDKISSNGSPSCLHFPCSGTAGVCATACHHVHHAWLSSAFFSELRM